jgi:pyruvate carboxylase subunit B
MEEALAEQALIQKAKAGKVIEKVERVEPAKGPGLRSFNVFVDDEYFEVGVEEIGGAPAINYVRPAAAPAATAQPSPPQAPKPKAAAPSTKIGKSPDADGTTLIAPMPGMIVRYDKQAGDAVKEGETVVVLEAMKMETPVIATGNGIINSIDVVKGQTVQSGQVLLTLN